jgi:heme-degrading monooxygenase HmoA
MTSADGAFVAIYRWRLKPEVERDFIENWQRITEQARIAGSGGSSLFRDVDGNWVAIARWASREVRSEFFASYHDRVRDDAQVQLMQAKADAAIETRYPTQELDLVLGLWAGVGETR